MPPITDNMDHAELPPIALPSDEELARAILQRVGDRLRILNVVAELRPRVESALELRPRGTS